VDDTKFERLDGADAEPRPRKPWKTPKVIKSELSETRSGGGGGLGGICTSLSTREAPHTSVSSSKFS
jgi:hypothetical protein